MNILYYLDWFPKLSQSFILNEIYYLSKQGHNVAVFSLNDPDIEITHEELDEINIDLGYADSPSVTSVPRHLTGSVLDKRSSYASYFHSPKRLAGIRFLTKQCCDFIDTLEYEIDHIHAHFLRWNKIPAAVIANDLGISSSLTTHAYDLYESPDEETLLTTCNAFDTILAISEYNREFLNVEVDPEADIEVVRMGIRMEKFAPTLAPTEPRFLTISRFIEKKGIEYALYAVAQCVDEYPELDYRLIGSGPRLDRYEEIIDVLGIKNNVTMLGSVSDEQLIQEIDQARAFLLPCVVAKNGDRDGIPVSIMEAMAMRTPAVSSYVSGIPELIDDGENGFLCSERSVTEISSTIGRCLSGGLDPIGKNARETVKQHHDIEVIGKALEAVFT